MRPVELALRPLEADDLDDLAVWRQRPENAGCFMGHVPVTASGQMDWYQAYLQDDREMLFVLFDAEGKRFGMAGLGNIDYKNQKAEFGRFLIGDPQMRGRGYGRLILEKMVGFGFDELNLRKIYLRVFADNDAAIALYEKVGFRREGLLRDDHFSAGRWRDVLLMAVFR